MIEDLSDHPNGTTFETDVAIVGAGAAGITLARSLVAANIRVCLLESGGKDYEQPVQDLAKGGNVGFPYYELQESRLRFFGGTTAIWGGRSALLDPIDFARRPWVTDSGWPIDHGALKTYYDQASSLLDLQASGARPHGGQPDESHGLALDPSLIKTSHWQFDEQFERFSLHRCADLRDAPLVRILLHATVTNVALNEPGTAVETLEIGNLNGAKARVRARAFVLAAGGIETPRLLLTSTDRMPSGIGNQHDLVGRYFIEHPRARGARVITDNLWPLLRAMPRFRRIDGQLQATVLRGAPGLQEKEGILNTAFSLAVRKPPDSKKNMSQRLYAGIKERMPPDHLGRLLWRSFRRGQILAREKISLARGWWRLKSSDYGLYMIIRGEQAPNPESRISLNTERDALGMQHVDLDWRFSDIDKHSVAVLVSTFDRELNRLGLGRLEPSDWLSEEGTTWRTDDLIGNHAVAGYHHIGTTRMATSAKKGVVDADCRVHGMGNLFIAGSSVFPTGGWANPTLTILALTLRLGDHLKREHASGTMIAAEEKREKKPRSAVSA